MVDYLVKKGAKAPDPNIYLKKALENNNLEMLDNLAGICIIHSVD